MKIPAGFHSDFNMQIEAIARNLATCSLTPDSARAAYSSILAPYLQQRSEGRGNMEVVGELKNRIYSLAIERDDFFGGEPISITGKTALWTTGSASRLERIVRVALISVDRDLLVDSETLDNRVADLIEEMRSPSHFLFARSILGDQLLHLKGHPVWLGDPFSSQPPVSNSEEEFPACAGIAPTVGPHFRLVFKLDQVWQPYFPDSCGYPYWRPGGRTAPLHESKFSIGMLEYLGKDLAFARIPEPIRYFFRNA